MPLGIPGFTYADLHIPERLGDLYDVFCREVAARDQELWAAWDTYRANPDAPRPAIRLPSSPRGEVLVMIRPPPSSQGREKDPT